MRILSINIQNYKSFRETGVRLELGFNIIVGENNVGKTALVEALSLKFESKPHLSLLTAPNTNSAVEPSSKVQISLELGKNELSEFIQHYEAEGYYIPTQVTGPHGLSESENLIQRLLDGCVIRYSLQHGDFVSGSLVIDKKEQAYAGMVNFGFDYTNRRPYRKSESVIKYNPNNVFFMKIAGSLRSRIYFFKAERLNLGEAEIGTSTILSSDASNLAQVIHRLQTNDSVRFQQFIEMVREVFPQVKYISAPPVSSSRARISVWPIDPSSRRSDLTFSLSESGTGIGQVLAILYVILTSDYSRTIIIDEPQSFLHPGAIRKLFEIMKQHPQHQYIITTHSPVALTSITQQTLLLVRKPKSESIVSRMDINETENLRLFLSEIGARPSDVFGADAILWVEGRTEEESFPLIRSRILKGISPGTVIVGVVQTGDFEGKYSKTIFEIYERLSQRQGILPPAIGFVFDREGRSETVRQDLGRQSKGTVEFLPRMMYENYLVNPQAIVAVFKGDGIRKTVSEIEQWLNDNKWDRDFFKRIIALEEQSEEFWLENVHGSKLLSQMFQAFGTEYDKVRHGFALTQWIVDHSPSDLQEVAEIIERALNRAK